MCVHLEDIRDKSFGEMIKDGDILADTTLEVYSFDFEPVEHDGQHLGMRRNLRSEQHLKGLHHRVQLKDLAPDELRLDVSKWTVDDVLNVWDAGMRDMLKLVCDRVSLFLPFLCVYVGV